MSSASKHRYHLIQEDGLQFAQKEHIQTPQRPLAIWIYILITLSCAMPASFTAGLLWPVDSNVSDRLRQFGSALEWSSELATMPTYSRKFEGSFIFENKFRGPPSPELDEEWARFTEHPLIDGTASLLSISQDDIRRANKTAPADWVNATVEYNERSGGGYMATLGVFHQLHCLNMLRKGIHIDYYRDVDPIFRPANPLVLQTHFDHCIEILRQVISCNGDTGLIVFKWVENNPVPYPDFNTWHECRNVEDILEWSHAREAPITSLVQKPLLGKIVEMPEAP